METERSAAQAQLDELGRAVAATNANCVQPIPSWFFPLFALAGPAVVGLNAATGDDTASTHSAAQVNLVMVGSILLALVAVAAAAVGVYRERASAAVRPKAPIHGGRTTPWMFVMVLAVTLGLITADLLTSGMEDAWMVALGSYVWLAFVPRFAWKRHVEALCAS